MIVESQDLVTHRAGFPALEHGVYANYATRGVMARAAIDAVSDNMLTLQAVGPSSRMAAALIRREERALRDALAALIGASPKELALLGSVSQAIALAFAGIDWKPDDVVVIGEGEPPGSWLCASHVAELHRVRIRGLPRPYQGPDFTARLARRLCPRTRLVVLSHVDWVTGEAIELPEVVAAIRNGPAANAVIAIDGAQAVGAREIDLRDVDVDLYAFSGQKWLCGPDGLACAMLRSDRLHPSQIGWRAISEVEVTAGLALAQGATRFESGTLSNALVPGLRRALATADKFAPAPVRFARIAALGRRLRDRLSCLSERHQCMAVLGSASDSGIVAVEIARRSSAEILARLAACGIVVRAHSHPPSVRIAVHYLTLDTDIDRVVEVLDEVLSEGLIVVR
ncbi:MAG TPA: aminotransferase class V-fold PLP-dependent enzyme [Allosphingosinicella sp.]|nr:aminotransferase class V-fold PLP-dependent enzyme [Allosphingosinicella sp.]